MLAGPYLGGEQIYINVNTPFKNAQIVFYLGELLVDTYDTF